MPDSPDFDQIAAQIVEGIRTAAAEAAASTRPASPPETTAPIAVVVALRQIWNDAIESAATVCQAHADHARQYSGDEAEQDIEVGEGLAAGVRRLKVI